MSASTPPRNALIAGGTGGLGRATALRLARQGHRVVCVYRSNEAARDALLASAEKAGVEIAVERADLSVPSEVGALFARLSTSNREPDYLINAAGITRDAPLVFATAEDFDAVLAANLRSTFLTCQHAARGMARRRFGRIVNFTSPAALLGNEGQSAYASAKAGVLGLTRTLARELARFGVTVNALSPGLVETEMTAGLSQAARNRMIARIPLGRMGTPEEIASAVEMLCHDLACYITGQCLSVDGGLTCNE